MKNLINFLIKAFQDLFYDFFWPKGKRKKVQSTDIMQPLETDRGRRTDGGDRGL